MVAGYRVGAGAEIPVTLVAGLAALELALLAVAAVALPGALPLLGAALAAQTLLVAMLVAPRIAVFAVMTVIGLSPDGWLADLGVTADLVVAQKLMVMALAGLLIARFGLRLDLANPMLPFGALFVVTSARPYGLGLTLGGSVRSFIGTLAPWTLGFARMPLYVATAFLTMVELLPLIQVVAGAALDVAGIRPLFTHLGRLQALKNPPTLAHFALWAMAAGTADLLRDGRVRHLVLLGVNGAILLATGARAPTAYAALFCGSCLLFLPSPRFGGARRMLLLLGGAVGVIAGVTAMLVRGPIRALAFEGQAGASGRDLLWPLFVDAIHEQPWLGHGIGAARLVLDESDRLATLIGTTTAHNEYLRMATEVGILGTVVVALSLLAWCLALSRALIRRERIMLRLAFVVYALLSITDNTLISPTALVFTSFAVAFAARGAAERALREAGVLAPEGRPRAA